MSKKQDKANAEVAENNDDISKHQSTKQAQDNEKQDQNNENECSVEDIEKELDELRPKPPSPKAQHRIEKEEIENDRRVEMHKEHKEPSSTTKTTNGDENKGQHKDNELIPGEPDPTVNDNVKIPVLNDRGDIELKSQQGSKLNKHAQ
ncbi:unnamed protein product [Rotaria sp. Silwood2]|nr:unnamed protein product [Rotaria sp. Silwood2]CAF2589054.1 unnamed protein product [Rotaria sp. Silwood2]CAF2784500.1 unnamed protein product [Rotaria sp. Silwood2]CAF3001069.1 unnamed protein product [Rotaria sp. Silwood2]CAF3910386.1 unnamed protein product [Rotaria sp. Silwood2]